MPLKKKICRKECMHMKKKELGKKRKRSLRKRVRRLQQDEPGRRKVCSLAVSQISTTFIV